MNATDEDRWNAVLAVQTAAWIQLRHVSVTAAVANRTPARFPRSSLSRIKVREAAMRGEIPGLSEKASWVMSFQLNHGSKDR